MCRRNEEQNGKFSCAWSRSRHSPSLILGIMMPWDLLIFENFWNFNKASQVHTLSISDDDFLLLNTCIAYIIRIVGNVLFFSRSMCEYLCVAAAEENREREEKKILLNIKPINYVVTFDVHIWYQREREEIFLLVSFLTHSLRRKRSHCLYKLRFTYIMAATTESERA